MIVYNVTVVVNKSIEAEFIDWLKNEHIPEVLNTGCFVKHHLFRLISHLSEEDTQNYSVQYFLNSMKNLNEYQAKYAQDLQMKTRAKYGDQVQGFRTIMEVV